MKKNLISVSILGPTNSGKSTLLNAINKKKISIVSHKVQTTNFNIESSLNYRNTKLIFVDTPGYYSKNKNLDFENKTNEAIIFSDVLLVVLDITSNINTILNLNSKILKSNKIKILVFNKIDLVNNKYILDKIKKINFLNNFDQIFYISAKKKINLEKVLNYIESNCKSNKNKKNQNKMSKNVFFSEITREAIFKYTNQEIPYQTSILTTKIVKNKNYKIYQNLVVRNNNQKRIIIGKSGKMLKNIGQFSRLQLEDILKSKVHLFLKVTIGT